MSLHLTVSLVFSESNATFQCMSQARAWISNTVLTSFFCFQLFEVRVGWLVDIGVIVDLYVICTINTYGAHVSHIFKAC